MLLRLTLLLFAASVAWTAKVDTRNNYIGWQVLEILLQDDDVNGQILEKLNKWSNPRYLEILKTRRDKGVAEVAVSPDALENLRQLQQDNKMVFNTVITDLTKKLNENGLSLRASSLASGDVTFDRYMNIDEITAYIEELPHRFPGKVSVRTVGESFENRPIYLVTVTTASKKGANKPVIFVDGGIHAREWISPAAAMNLIEQLVTTPVLTRDIEWQIIPLLNPDGYTYSWTHDRLWRKNRANVSWQCYGTDLNRNFGYHWGEAGSSDYECSSIYRGNEPFSEPESRALRQAMTEAKDRIEAYVTIHSYGQYILHPWGYTTSKVRINDEHLSSVGDGMAKAIRRSDGTVFSVGGAARLLYPAAGGSDDWAAGELKIPLVYTMELRDEGAGGFILPENLIKPSVNDAWLALKYLAKQLTKNVPRTDLEETRITVSEAKTRVAAEALDNTKTEIVEEETFKNPPARPISVPVVRDVVYSRPQQTRPIPNFRRPVLNSRYGGSSEESSSSEESRSDEDSDEDRK